MSFSMTLAHLVHHQSSHLPSSQLAFLSSPDAFAAAAAADTDVGAWVATMVESLQGVSIDPHRGDDIGRFVTDWGDEWGINLHFHRLSHFLAMFRVPKTSPLAAELVTAIEANLQSSMFKAAQMDRRMQGRFIRLRSRLGDRRSQIYKQHVQANTRQGMNVLEQASLIADAERVSTEATAPREASLLARQRALSDAAMPALAGRGWSSWAADRLFQTLPKFVPQDA